MSFLRAIVVAVAAALLAIPAAAQDREVPYWASIRTDELNLRVGPGEDYRIRWVYHRNGLPLKVLRLKEGWRLVEDHEGGQGWVMARFLTTNRSAIVVGKGLAELRASADESASISWRLQPGVVGTLGDCDDGWCQLSIGLRAGFIRQDRLWGPDVN